MLTVRWKYQDWGSRSDELRKFKQMDVPEFVRWMAKIVCQDLLKWTAPHGKHPSSEDWPDQKKLGENAVKRDIHDLWKPANSILPEMEAKDPKAAKSAKRYIRDGNVYALRTMLTSMGFHDPQNIVVSVTEAMHDARRGRKTGQVFIKSQRFLVLRTNSILALLRKKVRDVGKWKSGWGASASRLNVKPRDWPSWVRRHGNNGQIIDESNRNYMPSITLINDVPAPSAKQADAERAVIAAMSILPRKMKIQLEEIQRKRFRKMHAQ